MASPLLSTVGTPESCVELRDGSVVRIRPVRRADRERLIAFFEHLSPESFGWRFFTGGITSDTAADFVLAPLAWHVSVIALDRQGIVAHAMAVETDPVTVEVGFVVADEYQDQGLGTALLWHVASAAAATGHTTMTAEVLPANAHMLDVFQESGFPFRLLRRDEVVHAVAPTEAWDHTFAPHWTK